MVKTPHKGITKLNKMTNVEKQALRDKVAAIKANAISKGDQSGEDLAIELALMIPPDEDPGQEPPKP
jgi:hypothetical protein